jgi:hypothetical protein
MLYLSGMKDPRLAAALLESSPDALTAAGLASTGLAGPSPALTAEVRELVNTAASKNQVLITAATQPLPKLRW